MPADPSVAATANPIQRVRRPVISVVSAQTESQRVRRPRVPHVTVKRQVLNEQNFDYLPSPFKLSDGHRFNGHFDARRLQLETYDDENECYRYLVEVDNRVMTSRVTSTYDYYNMGNVRKKLLHCLKRYLGSACAPDIRCYRLTCTELQISYVYFVVSTHVRLPFYVQNNGFQLYHVEPKHGSWDVRKICGGTTQATALYFSETRFTSDGRKPDLTLFHKRVFDNCRHCRSEEVGPDCDNGDTGSAANSPPDGRRRVRRQPPSTGPISGCQSAKQIMPLTAGADQTGKDFNSIREVARDFEDTIVKDLIHSLRTRVTRTDLTLLFQFIMCFGSQDGTKPLLMQDVSRPVLHGLYPAAGESSLPFDETGSFEALLYSWIARDVELVLIRPLSGWPDYLFSWSERAFDNIGKRGKRRRRDVYYELVNGVLTEPETQLPIIFYDFVLYSKLEQMYITVNSTFEIKKLMSLVRGDDVLSSLPVTAVESSNYLCYEYDASDGNVNATTSSAHNPDLIGSMCVRCFKVCVTPEEIRMDVVRRLVVSKLFKSFDAIHRCTRLHSLEHQLTNNPNDEVTPTMPVDAQSYLTTNWMTRLLYMK